MWVLQVLLYQRRMNLRWEVCILDWFLFLVWFFIPNGLVSADWSFEMLAWRFVPFAIHWWYGCWRIHSSRALCKTNKGLFLITKICQLFAWLGLKLQMFVFSHLFPSELLSGGTMICSISEMTYDLNGSKGALYCVWFHPLNIWPKPLLPSFWIEVQCDVYV